MKTAFKNIFFGMAIGSFMLIPGVSGGTTAVILGIYDKLICAVSDIFKNFKKNIYFLLEVAFGGIIGAVIFSKGLLWLTSEFHFPMTYFFMGAILGSIPLMVKKANIGMHNIYNVAFAFLGIISAISVNFIPSGIMGKNFIMLFLCGIIIAVALILPGISTSHIMLVFGIYETALKAVSEMDILYISVLGTGILAGTFLFTKALGNLMQKFPSQTFMAITGFVMTSVYDIFPGFPPYPQFMPCILIFIGAFILICSFTKKFCIC